MTPMKRGAYEAAINHGQLPTRMDSWHDVFNTISWCLWPNSKKRLNELYCSSASEDTSQRSTNQQHIAHFDECGAVIFGSTSIFSACHTHDWLALRTALRWNQNFFLFGHGFLEQCLTPHRNITLKCILLQSTRSEEGSIDQQLSNRLNGFKDSLVFQPVPFALFSRESATLGIDVHIEDTTVFRPPRPHKKATIF